MKPVKTPSTNFTYKLPGGTEANDLPCEIVADSDGNRIIQSNWEPSEEERQAIADGATIYLMVWGNGIPPVAIGVDGVEPS